MLPDPGSLSQSAAGDTGHAQRQPPVCPRDQVKLHRTTALHLNANVPDLRLPVMEAENLLKCSPGRHKQDPLLVQTSTGLGLKVGRREQITASETYYL